VSAPRCENCDSVVATLPCSSLPQARDCRGCDREVCENCAGLFVLEGGGGEDGSLEDRNVWCAPCWDKRRAA
jgi:hypothetical protein